MDKRKQEEKKQVRKKWTSAMIKKLLPKNHRLYVLDSELAFVNSSFLINFVEYFIYKIKYIIID